MKKLQLDYSIQSKRALNINAKDVCFINAVMGLKYARNVRNI